MAGSSTHRLRRLIRGERSARGEPAAGEADSVGVLGVERFADVGRDTARLELKSGASCCGEENERRAPVSESDVRDLSLALRFFLRKLDGSSRERVEDEDWASGSSDTGDAIMMEGDAVDVGDCAGVPSTIANLICLASRSCSLSFAKAEEVGVWVGGAAMSPTPTVFSHKFPMRPFLAAVGGHLYTRNAVPSRTQSVRRHLRSRACTPGAENSILRGMIARK